MTKIYRFYLHEYPDNYIEYSSDDISKEEMDFKIMYEDFPLYNSVIREKWIWTERIYKNIFLLQKRRDDEDYVSFYKKNWYHRNKLYNDNLEEDE